MANRKNTFLLKRSNVSGNVPVGGQIILGELALNTSDVILYASGTTTNSILPIGWDRVHRTGDTMTGTLYAPSISATTISATTYQGLPIDIYTTGFTYNNANNFTITNNTGGTLNTVINTMTGLTVNGNLSATTINVGEFTGTSSSVATIQGTGDAYTTSSLKLYSSGGTNMYDFTDKGRFISYDPTGLVSLSLEAQGTTGVSEITSNSTTLIFQTNSGEYSFRRLTAGNILMYTNGKQFDLSATVGGAPNVTIGTNGYFGVGGTPTSPFHVFGDSYLGGGVTASTLNINNLGTGTSIYNLGVDVTGRVVSGTTGGGTDFTGGTVTGATNFTGGLTADTISATTLTATTIYGNGANITGITGSFGITVDGAGSVITNGVKGYAIIPYNATIIGWDIIGNTSGGCAIDIWKDISIPTSANTITGTEIPTLLSQQINSDNNLTSWNTSIFINDIIAFNVISASTVSRINLIIKVIKN
jgi:hypothetical protein